MKGPLFSIPVFLCVTLLVRQSYSYAAAGVKCSRNHEILSCGGCPPERTCANREIQFSCLQTANCVRSCVCEQGYIRNGVNECIPDKICNSCGKNAFWDCGPECDNECAFIETQNRTHCPIQNIVCNDKCYCKDGFARDIKGNCVPVCEC